MSRIRFALLLPILFCTGPSLAAAQLPRLPLSVEVRAGAAVPVGDFADDGGIGAETGFGFSAGASYHATSAVAVYGVYQWTQFGCASCDAVEIDSDVTDSGGEFGVRAAIPFQRAGLSPWASAGVLLHQLQLSQGGESLTSDLAAGFAVGAGVAFPLADRLVLTPAVSFRSYRADFELDDLELLGGSVEVLDVGTNVSYLTLDVGLAYHF